MAERSVEGRGHGRARLEAPAPSAANIEDLEKFEASEEAKRHQPSDVDAMGQDKRRQVVGHSYGPPGAQPDHVLRRGRGRGGRRSSAAGSPWYRSSTSHRPTSRTRRPGRRPRPTPAGRGAERQAVDPQSPAGARKPYPVPPQSPCAPPSKATSSRATHPPSSSTTIAAAARAAQPGSARSSVSNVTGIRHVSPARSTISAPAASVRPGPPTPPPRRRSRARACRPASPAGAPAGDRGSPQTASALAGRRAEQPDDHGHVAAQLEHRARLGRGPPRRLQPRRRRSHRGRRARRLVPRTCQPRAASSPPSSRPRQPQPTISARANYSVESPTLGERPTAAGPDRLVLPGLPLDVRLGDLLCAALSPQAFCASIICRTSSTSFCASTSGERVGFQSRKSATLFLRRHARARP